MKEIYKHLNYKDFIKGEIGRHSEIRGYQTKMAEAAGCQKSYFSQMLSTHIHLTLEHALGLTEFWGMGEEDAGFFLDLVQIERTSNRKLKQVIGKRMEQARERQKEPSRRYGISEPLSEEKRQAYYSSWHYAAVHILTGTAKYRTAEAIAHRLSLPPSLISRVLQELGEMGVVAQEESEWRNKARSLHIPKESYMNSVNHQQWRQRAILDAQQEKKGGLHYTAVNSHSVEDFQKLRDLLFAAVDSTRKVVAPSAPEDVSCLCLDFFWA